MTTTYKAQAIAHELADRLKIRPALAALGVVEAFDSADQNPLILIGAVNLASNPVAATTVAAAVVKVEPAAWPLAQDIFGNTAIAYAPHEIHILTEAGPAGTPTGGGLSAAALLELLAQVAAMGTAVNLYQSSTGSGLVYANIDDATKLVDTYAPNVWQPLISQQ